MYLLDLSLGSIPFKIVPLFSDASIPAPLPLLERVLEVLFSKFTKSILRFPLDLLHSVKAATLRHISGHFLRMSSLRRRRTLQ
jgi:hypothetical protein